MHLYTAQLGRRLRYATFLLFAFVLFRQDGTSVAASSPCWDVCTGSSLCGQQCYGMDNELTDCGGWGTCCETCEPYIPYCGNGICDHAQGEDNWYGTWCSDDCGPKPDSLCGECDPTSGSSQCGGAGYNCDIAGCCQQVAGTGIGDPCTSSNQCLNTPFPVCYDGECIPGFRPQ